MNQELITGLDSGSIFTATVVTDIAAVLLMVCMLAYTASYRRRGKLEDRIFFATVVINMAAALLSAILEVLDNLNPVATRYSGLIIAVYTVFVILYNATSLMTVLYLEAAFGDEGRVKRLGAKLSLVAVPLLICLAINPFTGMILYVNRTTWRYEYGVGSLITYTAFIYCLLSVIRIWKIDKRLFVLMIILVAVKFAFDVVWYRLSTTPFMLAVGLVYMHICLMNGDFYEEAQE